MKVEEVVLQKNEETILDLNIEKWTYGKDSNDKFLPEYEYDRYFNAKRSQGLTERAGRHYNFRLDGDFRSAVYAFYKDGEMFISSKDEATDNLERLCAGQNIWGLTDKQIKSISPELIEQYEKELINEWFKGI